MFGLDLPKCVERGMMSADREAAEGLLGHLAHPNGYSKQFLSSMWPS